MSKVFSFRYKMNREHISQYSGNVAAWKAEDERFDSLQKWAVHLFRSIATILHCYAGDISSILKKKRNIMHREEEYHQLVKLKNCYY